MTLPFPISEPATMVTDYTLAVLAALWGGRLWWADPVTRRHRWWAAAFFALSVGAATGGTVHGFRASLGQGLETVLWWMSLVAIGAFGAGSLMTAAAGLDGRLYRTFGILATLGLAGYAAIVWQHPEFRYAALASAIGVLALAAEQGGRWVRGRAPGAPWILSGVGVAIIGIAVQRRGIAPAPSFNHNDLFHVIQIGSTYLFYRGGRRFGA